MHEHYRRKFFDLVVSTFLYTGLLETCMAAALDALRDPTSDPLAKRKGASAVRFGLSGSEKPAAPSFDSIPHVYRTARG